MSQIANNVYELLKELFPQATIKEELYIKFKGQKLFFDYYLPQFNILFEIQGRQHYEFVQHFHGDAEGFRSHKKRDNLKLEYVEKENITLVVVDYNEKLTKQDLLKKIIEAQDDRHNN